MEYWICYNLNMDNKTTITVCVIDDSRQDMQRLHQVLLQQEEKGLFQFQCHFYDSPLQIQTWQYDWYIIDIEMAGINGFTAAEMAHERDPACKILFCSQYNDLIYDAMEYSVFHFLRKDYLEKDLPSALRKYQYSFPDEGYILETRNAVERILWKRIVYMEVRGNDLYIHDAQGKEYRQRKTMKELVRTVPAGLFIRPGHNCLVNCAYVSSIKERTVYLQDGTYIPVVRTHMKKVHDDYLAYLIRR